MQQPFDANEVIHQLKHYLPAQQALKDFIHHNSLHAFQHQKFYDGIFKASRIFGFQVHLQLGEYREMYQTGRIREDVVDRVIEWRKGKKEMRSWKEKMLLQEYNPVFEPRIGKLRTRWKQIYGIDLDNRVHPLLFRILCSFLDQGIALKELPVVNRSFTTTIRELESKSLVSFFNTRKVRQLFISGDYSIDGLLKQLVGDKAYYEQYLFDQQFAHHG